VSSVTLFSPAKVNLFLAITDRRPDGFHNLVSLVAPLDWGDTLHATLAGETSLVCDDATLPTDDSNLVLKAVAAFREATGWSGQVDLRLEKRTPMGAGLGGGSSNAVATLRALNELTGGLLSEGKIREVAVKLGADCALFLENAPVMMRGVGDRVELLDDRVRQRISGRRLLLFKPPFGVATPWAYGQMAARPESYLTADQAEARWESWKKDEAAPLEKFCYNSMETVVFEKYPALPALYAILRDKFGLAPLMSGSGSASLAWVDEETPIDEVKAVIAEMWGESAFMTTAALA